MNDQQPQGAPNRLLAGTFKIQNAPPRDALVEHRPDKIVVPEKDEARRVARRLRAANRKASREAARRRRAEMFARLANLMNPALARAQEAALTPLGNDFAAWPEEAQWAFAVDLDQHLELGSFRPCRCEECMPVWQTVDDAANWVERVLETMDGRSTG